MIQIVKETKGNAELNSKNAFTIRTDEPAALYR